MKTREAFNRIRNQKNNKFSLRVRLTLAVTAEIAVSIAAAYGCAALLNKILPAGVKVPLLLELIVVSLLVGVLVTGFLSKWFFEPIKKLRIAIEKVADGDFSVRLETESSLKEVQELYSGFNLMTNELAATEMLQNDFVSNVSHEFKTPINAIEGYSTLLQGGDNLDEDQMEYVNKILFNTKRLSELVGNILLLSKLENQSIETNQTKYRLDEQIRESIVALEPEWVKKDIDFDVELDEIKYLGNERLLRYVWDNLIGNAIKFNPRGGLVRLRLTSRQSTVIFTVEDRGPGIAEEEKKHIFDKFYQADSSHRQEGHGLGLALVKRILALTDGDVTVDNIPDGGCKFTVTLKR